jgi:hypothetical protein
VDFPLANLQPVTGRFSDLKTNAEFSAWTRQGMRKLVRQIKRELETAKHCSIYEEELTRVWPNDGDQRETQIARFAEDHGFRLRFYRDGLCAIFDKAPREGSEE